MRRVRSLLPHGPADLALQFALFGAFQVLYELGRGVVDGARSEALVTAARVLDIERTLGIDWERAVQTWAIDDAPDLVLDVANQTYFNCQFTISFGFVLFVYLRRNHAYYHLRNTILAADLIGLAGYLLLPTAPPRMLGYVDTLQQEALNFDSLLVRLFANQYAAMPSLHTAYALIVGLTGVLVMRSLLARAIWLLYPGLVVFSIVATGNHWTLDAVAGAFVAVCAIALSVASFAGRLPRRGVAPRGFLVPADRSSVETDRSSTGARKLAAGS